MMFYFVVFCPFLTSLTVLGTCHDTYILCILMRNNDKNRLLYLLCMYEIASQCGAPNKK